MLLEKLYKVNKKMAFKKYFKIFKTMDNRSAHLLEEYMRQQTAC